MSLVIERNSVLITLSDAAKKDIARIDDIFSQQQLTSPDRWLFGVFSIVYAMYAPIILRIKNLPN